MDNHKWEGSILDNQEDFSPFQKFRKRRRVWFRREDGTEMELESPFLFPVLQQEEERFEWDTPKPPAQIPAVPAAIVETWGDTTTMLDHIKKLALSALPDLAKKPTAKWTAADKKTLKTVSNGVRKKLVAARHQLYKKGPLPAIGSVKIPFGFKALKRGLKTDTALLPAPRVDTVLADLHNKGLINITQDQLDVFQRISNVETSGMITTLNSWDTAVVSIGFFQLTLHTGKLQRWIAMAPAAFKRYGIELHATNKYAFDPTEKHPAIGNVEYKDRAQLRFYGWAERFHYAGLDQDVIIAQVKFGIKYLEEQKNTLKRRLKATFKQKNTDIYDRFINDHYNKSAYIRGLFQESLNNNPARATRAVYKAMTEPDTKDWLEGYKKRLIDEDLKTIVTKTSVGTSIVLKKTQPELGEDAYGEYEDAYGEVEGSYGEMEDAYDEQEDTYGEQEEYDEMESDDASGEEMEDVYDEMESDDSDESEFEDTDDELEDDEFEEADEEMEDEDASENEFEDTYDEMESDDPSGEEMEDADDESEYDEMEDEPVTEEMEEDLQEEYETNAPAGITDYLRVSAVKGLKLRTGMFIPPSCTPSAKTDIVVYLHGLWGYGSQSNGMELYWQQYSKIRQHFASSNKNALLLAPSLSKNPQIATLLRANYGFDKFIDACFKAMKAAKHIPEDAEPGRIIIAAHSAGGSPMSDILNYKNKLLSQVAECWGFDCLYGYNFENWLKKDRTKNKLYHYWAYRNDGRKSTPGVNGDSLAKRHSNMQNIAPKQKGVYHQGIMAHAWKYELNNRPWFEPVTTKELDEDEMPSPAKAFSISLSNKSLVLVAANKKEKKAEVKETPAVYLKAIVEDADPSFKVGKWFGNFTDFTFLGRKLNDKQYIHMDMAILLQKIEDYFMKAKNTTSAKRAGDALGLPMDRIAAHRPTSATALYSFHMFGLAVDIDYKRNPMIQNRGAFDSFMTKVGWLTAGKTIPMAKWSMPGSTSQYLKLYDQLRELNNHFILYFSYLKDHTALQARLDVAPANTWGKDKKVSWQGMSLSDAVALIQKDLREISKAWQGTRTEPEKIFSASGFLSHSREFVKGMVDHGMDWGAWYGDIMHFDMRTTGSGAKMISAIGRYKNKKTAEAKVKFKAQQAAVTP
ncbi:hypothetical protein GFS24_01825 [Chitinophaga sp. SYP-B3965]|uniref:hypothetical protein n=1 Tax=Chitinophaga sp. SYP-B3965 TaxID=2663120 RepID=UPI001299DC5D|nr:hypothetical protein [Chitinophaga sp. SYP-B3965]MRG43830.1 hypothetical protein [Chitinophaga sp. SYP-B3965]